MASIKNPKDTSGHAIAASQVNGTNVYDASGEKLGSVHDVILNKMSGKAEYAIMSFGGFLGIGDKYHPLPWNQLRYDTAQEGYVVNLDRNRLQGAPAYAPNEMMVWDDLRGRDIDAYYRTSLR
jgi:sporulation protein YlmC with PRC-barrel domain